MWRENLEQALTLYRQLGDGEGQVRASHVSWRIVW